jgi:hypothetical protein
MKRQAAVIGVLLPFGCLLLLVDMSRTLDILPATANTKQPPPPSPPCILDTFYTQMWSSQTHRINATEPDAGVSKLDRWIGEQIAVVYPQYEFGKNGTYASTPSLVRNDHTGDTVLGVRIRLELFRGLLMLCDLQMPLNDTTCQDSGLSDDYIPPECDTKYWLNPQKRVFFGIKAQGVEDARLFFLDDDTLAATFVTRGCHSGTIWNSTSPNFSTAYAEFQRSELGTWKLKGHQKLLSLRESDGTPPEDYPGVTKSWVPIPHQDPVTGKSTMFFSYGWSKGFARNLILNATELPTPTLALAKPIDAAPFTVSKGELDLKNRGSTNLVSFDETPLLYGIGHFTTPNPYLYHHFWYAICSTHPFEMAAYSAPFQLPKTENSNISFALGLAVENRYAYVSYSESDSILLLTRYRAAKVRHILNNFNISSCVRGE